jgi:hypothetical protein
VGQDVPSSIRDAVENSDYLILLASPGAAKSNWVRFELEGGWQNMRRIIYCSS